MRSTAARACRVLVFDSVSFENFSNEWKARESYEVISADEFIETFELAEPGKDFGLQPQSLQAQEIVTWHFIFASRVCCPMAGRRTSASRSRAGASRNWSAMRNRARVTSASTVALPGMCNVHSHGFQRGMAGLTEFRGPEADNFWSWRTLMYRFVGRMTPEDIDAITAQAYVEMLEGGFHARRRVSLRASRSGRQAVRDPAETAARVASAAARTGIGLTLLPVFYAHGGFDGAPPNEGQRRFVTGLDEFARLMEAGRQDRDVARCANLGVAPHSLRAVTPEELAQRRGARRGAGRFTFTPPNRPGSRALRRLVGRAAGAMAARSRGRSIGAGAWCMRRT